MGCIGRFVDGVSREQEERLLSTQLVPFRDATFAGGGAGCLVAVAFGVVEKLKRFEAPLLDDAAWSEIQACRLLVDLEEERETVAERFNALCLRLGGVKGAARMRLGRAHDEFAGGAPTREQLEGAALAGIMIRDRILRNRVRRLQGARRGERRRVAREAQLVA